MNAEGMREFLSPAIANTLKYFPPRSNLVMLSAMESLDSSSHMTGLHAGIVVAGYNTKIPFTNAAMSMDGEDVMITRETSDAIRNGQVVCVLNNSRYMRNVKKAMLDSGCYDFIIIGLSAGQSGVAEIGMHDARVEERAGEYVKSVKEWLVTEIGSDEPLIIGMPPIGAYHGKKLAEELGKSGCYTGLGIERIQTHDLSTAKNKVVAITDGSFIPGCAKKIREARRLLDHAKKVLFIAEYGPHFPPEGEPENPVNFSCHWTDCEQNKTDTYFEKLKALQKEAEQPPP